MLVGKAFFIIPLPVVAAVAQWVKCWPTDLAVPALSPAWGEIFSTINRFHCTQPSIIIHSLSRYD